MKSRFNLIYEEVMHMLLESINSEIDELNVSDELKATMKSWPDAKKKKAAIRWFGKGFVDDLKKFDTAYAMTKDYTAVNTQDKFDELFNPEDEIEQKKLDKLQYDPHEEPRFSNWYDAKNGVEICEVENSKEGQMAARKAQDYGLSPNSNCWCLTARKSKFGPRQLEEFSRLTEGQKKKLGFYDPDDLAVAWQRWKHYSAYPKRIAFKDGKCFAFCASDQNKIEWWDENNVSTPYIPGGYSAKDNKEFIANHIFKNRIFLIENPTVEDAEKYLKTYDDKIKYLDNSHNLSKLPLETWMWFAKDEDISIRLEIARNTNTPPEILKELAKDKDFSVRFRVATNKNTPSEILKKLARSVNIRKGIAYSTDTSVEVLKELAKDVDKDVRYNVARNENTPVEILKEFAKDKDFEVRLSVAVNKNTPSETLKELAKDKNTLIREKVARNHNTSVEVLEELAKDVNEDVRYNVAMNENTPVEILKKIAENKKESSYMRKTVAKIISSKV